MSTLQMVRTQVSRQYHHLLATGRTISKRKAPRTAETWKHTKENLLGRPQILFGIQNSTIKSDRNVGYIGSERTSMVNPTREATIASIEIPT
jgi:hypothetical protein